MKISDKYLLINILKTVAFVLVTITLIFSFFKFLEEIPEVGTYKYNYMTAFEYVILQIPATFDSLNSLSTMIGVIIALGAMNSNKELQIYQISSISIRGLIIKIVKISLFISFFLFILSQATYPFSSEIASNLKTYSLGKSINKIDDSFWLKREKKFIYIKKYDLDGIKNEIQIFEIDKNSLKSYLFDKNASIKNDEIKLNDPIKSTFNNSNELLKINLKNEIAEQNIITLNEEQISLLRVNENEMSMREIFLAIIFSIENQTNFDIYLLELIKRIMLPFTTIGMVLIGVPFILNFSRETSVGNRIFIGIII